MKLSLNRLRRAATGCPTLLGKIAPFCRTPMLLALGAVAIATSGCTTEVLRSRAANDLQCERQAVQVDDQGFGRYLAHGCGDSATYYVVGPYGGTGVLPGDTIIGPTDRSSEQSQPEVSDPPPPLPLRESPSAAGGFSFGASESDTRAACLQAGHVYSTDASNATVATCDGTASDVGAHARATFAYCAGKLCRVSLGVGIAPAEDPSRALVKWKDALADKYGSPSDSHEHIPTQCLHDVTPCLRDKSGSISFDWQWESQERITLSTEVDDTAGPWLNISYVAPPAGAKVARPGL